MGKTEKIVKGCCHLLTQSLVLASSSVSSGLETHGAGLSLESPSSL